MDAVTVRRMRPGEEAAVADLLVRANEEHLAVFPPVLAGAYRLELRDVAGRAAGTEILVAEEAGRLVGSATLFVDAAHDSHPWPPGGSVLRFLAIDPAARGRGLGRRLTVECIAQARAAGAEFLGLHTAPLMVAARRVYQRLGFERAPELDFDPAAHYAGGTRVDDAPEGHAYVLRLDRRAQADDGRRAGPSGA